MNYGKIVTSISMMVAPLLSEAKLIASLEKALKENMISADVVCKGGLCVNYSIQNQINDSLLIMLPAGWRMNSVKDSYQDILVVRDQVLALGKLQKRSFEIKGYCCEATNSGPIAGIKYETGKMADPALKQVALFLNKNKNDENTEQYAVWSISNNKPTNNITGPNDSLSTALRYFVAAIKGEPIPWYTLQKKVYVSSGVVAEYPVKLRATVPYNVQQTAYAWFYVVDSLGLKKGAITGQWLNPGNHDYLVNFNVSNFKKGKYRMLLANDKETYISRDFEI